AAIDRIKSLTFKWATKSGITFALNDVAVPPTKPAILDRYEKDAEKVETQYSRGLLTDDERKQELIESCMQATDEVTQAMEENFGPLNAINMMAQSGARGNIDQVRQLAGMRGLVANPRGEIIPRPIKSNFREGLTVLEYFISTHGARKGLADTALRTADSGYLTRRLVDVAQELIIREEDCGTRRGIWVEDVTGGDQIRLLETRLEGRCLLDDITLSDGTVIPANSHVDHDLMVVIANDPANTRVRVRSVLTCETVTGVCANC